MRTLLVLACGLAMTSVGAILQYYIGIRVHGDIFTFMLPYGALVLGMLAGAGYYCGARFFNHWPDKTVYAGLVLISVSGIGAMFLAKYLAVKLNGDTHLASLSGFVDYLQFTITHQYRITKHGHLVYTTGAAGYVIVVLETACYTGSAWAVYRALLQQKYCTPCGKFMRHIGRITRCFANMESFKAFHEKLYRNKVFSTPFMEMLKNDVDMKKPGVIIDFSLSKCPSCGSGLFVQTTKAASSWYELKELGAVEPVTAEQGIDSYFQKPTAV